MCRPHSSKATPPSKSSRTMIPMLVSSGKSSRRVRLSPNDRGSTLLLTGSCQCVAPAFTLCHRLQRRKAALEVGLEVVDIFEPDVKPQRRAARRPFGRRAIEAAIEGNDQAFEAAPRKTHAEQFQGI